MWKQSRRDFLVSSAAGALALPAGVLLAAPAGRPADMTIARWAGAKDLSNAQIDQAAGKMTEKAMEALGGMKRFVKRGDVVWIKPNIGWDRKPEYAANTNPEIVAALVRLAFDAGAKTVKVGDNPVHAADKTYESSGIAAAAKAAGAKVVFLDKTRFRKAAIGGEKIREIPVYPEIMDCDLVINVPLVKHHVLSNLTMCMKNYLGVVENRQDLPPGPARLHCRHHPLHEGPVAAAPAGRRADPHRSWTHRGESGRRASEDDPGRRHGHRRPGRLGRRVDRQEARRGRLGRPRPEGRAGKIDYRSLALREIAVS